MHIIQIDGIDYDLESLEKDCWIRLLNGSLKSKDPLHNPTVANVNNLGINLRTVVLRNVNTLNKTLAFHTDIRSGKWKELEENSKVSWMFYSAVGRVQIRLAGNVTLHKNDVIADQAWIKSNENSRKIYMGEIAPSLESEIPTSGVPAAFENTNPTLIESEVGRKNFGVVVTKVSWMEWLWLNSKGHRRASFEYDEENKITAKWLVP